MILLLIFYMIGCIMSFALYNSTMSQQYAKYETKNTKWYTHPADAVVCIMAVFMSWPAFAIMWVGSQAILRTKFTLKFTL